MPLSPATNATTKRSWADPSRSLCQALFDMEQSPFFLSQASSGCSTPPPLPQPPQEKDYKLTLTTSPVPPPPPVVCPASPSENSLDDFDLPPYHPHSIKRKLEVATTSGKKKKKKKKRKSLIKPADDDGDKPGDDFALDVAAPVASPPASPAVASTAAAPPAASPQPDYNNPFAKFSFGGATIPRVAAPPTLATVPAPAPKQPKPVPAEDVPIAELAPETRRAIALK